MSPADWDVVGMIEKDAAPEAPPPAPPPAPRATGRAPRTRPTCRPAKAIWIIDLGLRFESGYAADLAMGWPRTTAANRASSGCRKAGLTIMWEADMSPVDFRRAMSARTQEATAA